MILVPTRELAQQVTDLESMKGITPEAGTGEFVAIGRRRYPVKQVGQVITGQDHRDFTADEAVRAMTRLGFTCHTLPEAAPVSALSPLQHASVLVSTGLGVRSNLHSGSCRHAPARRARPEGAVMGMLEVGSVAWRREMHERNSVVRAHALQQRETARRMVADARRMRAGAQRDLDAGERGRAADGSQVRPVGRVCGGVRILSGRTSGA